MKVKPLVASFVFGLLSLGVWGDCYHEIPERIDDAGAYTAYAFEQVEPAGLADEKLGVYKPFVAEAECGFAFERLKPQYAVGDTLVPPEDVDWVATWDLYGKTTAQVGPGQPFVMDPDARLVYPTGEGVAEFAWVLADGSVVTNSYVIGGVAAGARPLRVYQTDDTRIVTPVSLDNRYAQIFGSVAELGYGPAAGMEGMDPSMSPSNTVVYGVYIDETSNTIYAKGAVTGKGVIVFYDSVEHRRIIAVRVVDVRQAVPSKVKCRVGETITPYGAGHPTGGLRPVPLQAAVESPKTGGGPYLYQHKGANGFSPHDGDVFALRPCPGKDYKVQVWWHETDELGLEWPFEFVEYEIEWPERMVPFLRSGDDAADWSLAPLSVPPAYSGELTEYQELNGARAADALAEVRGGLVYARGMSSPSNDVRALLKLTGDDNVWFVPLRLVSSADGRLFDLEAQEWDVGRALAPRGGALSGLKGGRGLFADVAPDLSLPAHLRRGADDLLPYAVDLYGDVTRCDDVARGALGLPSEIVPVGTNGVLEAWWSCAYAQEGMPAPLTVPVLPQRYAPAWPRPGTLPQIVLASGEGSACTSDWCEVGALVFGSSNTCLRLPRRPYLEDEGTLDFRYRSAGPDGLFEPGDGVQVLSFARPGPDGAELRVLDVAGADAGAPRRLEVTLSRPVAVTRSYVVAGKTVSVTTWTNATASVSAALSGAADAWHHVAVVETEEGNGRTFAAYLDGERVGALRFEGSFAGAGLPEAAVGGTDGTAQATRARVGAEIGEIRVWNRPLSADAVAALGLRRAVPGEDGLFAYLTFEEGTDLAVDGSGIRTCAERTQNRRLTVEGAAYLRLEGPPTRATGVIASDSTPAVYRQPDGTLPGFNPNEEHAFVRAGGGGYVAWALRCDLNGPASSEPVVLVEYERNGRARVQAFEVVATNALYPAFSRPGEVREDASGPHPFDYLSIPNMTQTSWTVKSAENPVYRDRTSRLWFRCAGAADVYRYYPAEEAFDFPGLDVQPALGAPVPWMAYWDGNQNKGKPTPWHWDVSWPPTNSVPKMRIGQTLHRASDGLAEVWNCSSLAVLYPDPAVTDEAKDYRKTVTLFDPTVARTCDLKREALDVFGFSLGERGNLTQRGSKLFFSGLPPTIADRFYYDTEKSRLEFVGRLEEPAAGATILYVNVLSSDEAKGLKDICTVDATFEGKSWAQIVDDEFAKCTTKVLNSASWKPMEDAAGDFGKELVTEYDAKDHYALAAMGRTGWVTMIENDGPSSGTNRMTNAGDPITMRVFRVEPEYYTGRTVTRQDPYNLLSQQLAVMYTESFAGSPDDFEFEWRRAQPLSNGNPPEDYARDYARYAAADGPRFTLGANGSPLSELVNTYYVCRYRAKEGTAVYANLPPEMKGAWSAWCEPPALAEGWVQRVLNNVTPFTQRMTDLYNNAAETAASMVTQAGRPWNGNVAMNQENLASVGLVQLYQTLLNVAESMSTMKEGADAAVCQQLLLAAERLHDLYTVLGDDAFSDAMDPTVGVGTAIRALGWTYDIDIGYADTALFSFDNQLRTLLDEELCLLRGRSGVSAPDTHTFPVYNRLVWNLTRGVTAGEVAYAVNYDARIRAANGAASEAVPGITADDAAVAYPQGHGDAYGHYLTALSGWLRLLRNPNFDWPRGASAMNVGDFATAVDYFEESKVAAAASALARTAAEVVDRTARAAWRDHGGACGAGYLDADRANAFGYGEWASRGGYGALCNWAVANSLLPADPRNQAIEQSEQSEQSNNDYRETDLSRIDRGTVASLSELCTEAEAIARKVDTMDAGLNPLGLSADAVPFDITPIGLGDGTRTHYEQVRERAGTALRNAKAVLERAQESSQRLREIETAEGVLEQESVELEADYDAQLVAIFGKPYPADVGPTGTYKQGYEGPDYYHYMWTDLTRFGLSTIDTVAFTNLTWDKHELFELAQKTSYSNGTELVSITLNAEPKIKWELSRTGLVVAPSDKLGAPRPVNGEIQLAYAKVLSAYTEVRAALDLLASRQTEFDNMIDLLSKRITASNDSLAGKKTRIDTILEKVKNQTSKSRTKFFDEQGFAYGDALTDLVTAYVDIWRGFSETSEQFTFNAVGNAGAVAVSGPFSLAVAGAVSFANVTFTLKVARKTAALVAGGIVAAGGAIGYSAAFGVAIDAAKDVKTKADSLADAENELSKLQAEYARDSTMFSYYEAAKGALGALGDAETAAHQAALELQSVTEALSAVVSKGTALMEKRALERKREVSAAAKLRYHDMFLRHERDAALRRYSSAFDLAQKYTFLAAKAYGYETGTSLTDAKGAAFLAGITGTRSLGAVDGAGEPILPGTGDAGLAGVLAQLDANWLVEKSQLGLDNPQPYATWFSLRKELLQILDGEAGDAAWKRALRVRRVEDLNALPEYARLCQPVRSDSGSLALKEPGLVIEFPSTIDFARNFFGNDLVNEGSAFDSSYFATKIAAAGVFFENYNAKVNGYARKETKLAEEPSVYLVPASLDRMRAPGQDDGDCQEWNVLDQVIPAPYAIGPAQLDAADWFPTDDGSTAGADAAVRVRRYPAFRAYGGAQPTDAMLDAPRLAGRSVWNTRWMLIIPAGALNADRDAGLDAFIDGADMNHDGTRDVSGVTDIKIGFKTYSHGGR